MQPELRRYLTWVADKPRAIICSQVARVVLLPMGMVIVVACQGSRPITNVGVTQTNPHLAQLPSTQAYMRPLPTVTADLRRHSAVPIPSSVATVATPTSRPSIPMGPPGRERQLVNPYHIKYLAHPTALSISPSGQQSMRRLLAVAKADSVGKQPDGLCYTHVGTYLERVGYGGILAGGFEMAIPAPYWHEAHQFADYLNLNGHAARLGLQRLALTDVYAAPAGAIVVVRAGTPGTHNPTAGDIAVANGDGHFYNGGEMSYGGAQNFAPGNTFVLGIYVPE